MIPGPPKRVNLGPPSRGRGDPYGSSRRPRPRGACAEPLRVAVPSRLPPLPGAGRSAQPEQVRRLRRRRTPLGRSVAPAARACRLSPGGDLAGERTPHARRMPSPPALLQPGSLAAPRPGSSSGAGTAPPRRGRAGRVRASSLAERRRGGRRRADRLPVVAPRGFPRQPVATSTLRRVVRERCPGTI